MSDVKHTKIIGANPANGRSELDFYPTPPEVTFALLNFLNIPEGKTIWEPACGEMDMANAIKSRGYSVISTDIAFGQDFLTEPLVNCDWIITNPPFGVSEKFIERCAEHGKPFALLLKSQYWHAKKRYDLFDKIKPAVVCPLTWRPDFQFKKHEKRRSPLMDVQWCIWYPPYNQKTIFFPMNKEIKEVSNESY